MIITSNKIKELKSLFRELNLNKEIISDGVKTVQDRFGDNLVKLNRDGNEVELSEKILWKEVYLMGVDSQAGQILKNKYPQIFENYIKDGLLVRKLNDFTLENLGFGFMEMSLIDLIDLMSAIYKYQLLKLLFIDKLIYAYGFLRTLTKKIISLVYLQLRGDIRETEDKVEEQVK